jgi:hypothetical protein
MSYTFDEIIQTGAAIAKLYPDDSDINLLSDVISVLYFRSTGIRLPMTRSSQGDQTYIECLIDKDDEFGINLVKEVVKALELLRQDPNVKDSNQS